MTGLAAALARIESLVRAGEPGPAALEMEALSKKRLTRAEALSLARLTYRAGAAPLGLRLLHRYVRSPKPATDAERAVYAVCLERVGATEEAAALLDTVDAARAPSALFFRALVHIARWDYAGAVPLLVEYLRTPRLEPYQRLVAKTNLAASFLVTGRARDGVHLVRELLYRTSLGKWHLLHANALELYAQSCLLRGKPEAAERVLDRAERVLREAGTVDALWVRKWRAIASLSADGPTAATVSALERVKDAARSLGAWETLRDAEAHEAIARGDGAGFWKVFFGTPYPAYREFLLRRNPAAGEPPEAYEWRGDGARSRPAVTIDVATTRVSGTSAALRPGKLLHRALLALTLDYFRPLRTAALFGHLFPDELYNPDSAPARVHEAVKRLRRWLESGGIPLRIDEQAGAYRLGFDGDVAIRVPLAHPLAELTQRPEDRLRRRWRDVPFSSADAAALLGVSKRTAQRSLETLVAEGTLHRTGATSTCRYRFR